MAKKYYSGATHHRKSRDSHASSQHHAVHMPAHDHDTRHQGPIHLNDMTSIVQGDGGNDMHAHSSHHEMNDEHYTGVGLSPHGHYGHGEEECNDGHGGMGENYQFE